MVNKRGIIRILEATIALVIIISFLFLTQARTRDVSQPDFSERAQDVLEEISRQSSLRDEVSSVSLLPTGRATIESGVLYDFVDSRIPESYLKFQFRICEQIDKICSSDRFIEGDVYAAERVIVPSVDYNNVGGLEPRKIALFIYRNEV
ncbi:hypothetical protein COU62_01405 [Candidatus Pacearchaeota archaeon CG10_big_fil_rev_8_21_14_0_10_35_219]|nr:hypothetical protein [Candidatus Pacearchaeota archaeon]OIO43380.1 MAG: hypothetical protein AUJ63_00630 [Candidatus Pacearchaeota archaeon CG1_02_35_32]PIO08024.1 MAG: hypothetical protein COU62_01405 [Candidatus Pacearchaeota archaeon CG10_big_fil_rev_8_21_14_0_10_35_219]PIY81536.1 MAG: hypothetical protein COY79_02245 [Candidatus Pacearchaeota archaeon CG_4_10_14_0_8_um_filter_35_169]PIZ78911.1 MAG: hypothetical protein COY00_04630 [Candidatus Pacearchaeota archaeon CG_4_10_14_0_2_um_filt